MSWLSLYAFFQLANLLLQLKDTSSALKLINGLLGWVWYQILPLLSMPSHNRGFHAGYQILDVSMRPHIIIPVYDYGDIDSFYPFCSVAEYHTSSLMKPQHNTSLLCNKIQYNTIQFNTSYQMILQHHISYHNQLRQHIYQGTEEIRWQADAYRNPSDRESHLSLFTEHS